jgi:twitching motility protein PilT
MSMPPEASASANNDEAAAIDIFHTDQPSLAKTPLKKYFEAAVKFESSDLLLRGGNVPKLRLRGTLKALDTPAVPEGKFESYINDALTPELKKRFLEHGSLDLGTDFDINGETHRFRINLFRTRGRAAIAARRVSNEIFDFDDLLLPTSLRDVADRHQGLILLCGVTGSGKSTTIASMLNHINKKRACHIITIEDPIEYLFSDQKAIINQREVGIDVPDFSTALRALVRENPDVVLIGEMRDKETFEAALQASETGHLVFGTIHASSASQAFGRIYDLFPAEERDAIRTILAYQMQAFVYQKLLPTVRDDIQRVPAVEILLQSPATRKYILDGREPELDEVIKNNRESGMQSFTDSLVQLVNDNYVHPKVAQQSASSPDEVKMRLRGITSGGG